ncbi:MAG: DUF2520 domain-containing protein [Clostridium sp.]|jgi:conserved domain protein|uniref:Rossmann-like and DUF2520 domain-containing protein n=1 Tax=Clostridium sp. TaxID=1506 RepID=UPI0025E21884|nr:Rossmann-like and DUF2520 domain-containing protein [Clostridium sp.]MCI6691742.1 DUF2520 domain-containing protein [Clostridium sp.]MDY2632675.1 DUF2520 domain-containing protein [Clostridium sp.]MDY4252975.1 DUF2520 domain-containing protein [Clostridium sp.]
MKIGFIGAGKVGFSMGKYLKDKGINVTGYYSRNENSSLEASLFTNTNQYKELKNLVEESDTIVISTPDDKILEVWNKIKNLSIKNKFICHLSGSLSSNIFSNISHYGAYGYSIHPIFPISDKYNSYKSLKNAFITIEGDRKYINEVKLFIESLGNKTKVLEKSDKTLYHLASVISSNLIIGLINISLNYLKEYGFTEKEAINALYPLIKENIEGINNKGVINSLTGPVERGDFNTINRHLLNIKEEDKDIYISLSNKILSLALEKNKDRDYGKIREILGGIYEEHSGDF